MDHNKHGVKMTKEEFDKINNKPSFSKLHKPFIKESNVKVYDNDPKYMMWNGIWLDATVLYYNEMNLSYKVKFEDGSTKCVNQNDVKGWWEE